MKGYCISDVEMVLMTKPPVPGGTLVTGSRSHGEAAVE